MVYPQLGRGPAGLGWFIQSATWREGVGSGTSSNVQWRKGRRGSKNLSTSSYARRPADGENR